MLSVLLSALLSTATAAAEQKEKEEQKEQNGVRGMPPMPPAPAWDFLHATGWLPLLAAAPTAPDADAGTVVAAETAADSLEKLEWRQLPPPFRRLSLTCKGGDALLRVEFACAEPSTVHSPWRWHSGLQAYLPDTSQVEDNAAVLLETGGKWDAWVWRAGRSAFSGHADDLCFALDADGTPLSLPDAGEPPWRLLSASTFSGNSLPRFAGHQPTGSAADVEVSAAWSDGLWAVEFRRRLDTGHADDTPIVLSKSKIKVLLGVGRTPRRPSPSPDAPAPSAAPMDAGAQMEKGNEKEE